MSELELFRASAEAIKTVSESGDCRIFAVDGKALFMERNSSRVQSVSSDDGGSAVKSLAISAVALFGMGVVAGTHYQSSVSAQQIQKLQDENLVLEAKLSKIRDLVQ